MKTPAKSGGSKIYCSVDLARIGLALPQPYFAKIVTGLVVDLARIGLALPQCECGVLPLDYRPISACHNFCYEGRGANACPP